MTDIYRNVPLDVTDVLGRTPLHIAVLNGSTDAIPILSNGCTFGSYVTAPLMQDKWLRCPLHWACTHAIGSNGSYTNASYAPDKINFSKMICTPRKVMTDMFDAVRVLLAAYPEATIIRDCDGMTPLEIAIQHNADPSIICMVEKVEQSIRRERKNIECDSFWAESNNAETLSLTITESDSFPKGFPGEISVHTRQTVFTATNPFDYACFEC
jgi:ankyrin repeat protein